MSPQVTLSFDNGPTPGITGEVLDVLAAHEVRAAFFVVGRCLEAPGALELAARARDEGHWIGNHTLTHEVQFGDAEDPERPAWEIAETQALIGELAHPDRLFRPYGGGGVLGPRVLTPDAVRVLQEGGYTCVLWNCVPHDWDDPDGWVETCLREVASRPWSLVVLHDLDTGAMRHLPRFLEELAGHGITVTQQFPDDCVPIRHGRILAPLDALGGV